ncbi:hypothetical protein BDW22DRAFT_1364208 [Trametopsis cervina]|nr:hypothetical protein BDW22DRAFT_1364208 [Trametopsis cervina]
MNYQEMPSTNPAGGMLIIWPDLVPDQVSLGPHSLDSPGVGGTSAIVWHALLLSANLKISESTIRSVCNAKATLHKGNHVLRDSPTAWDSACQQKQDDTKAVFAREADALQDCELVATRMVEWLYDDEPDAQQQAASDPYDDEILDFLSPDLQQEPWASPPDNVAMTPMDANGPAEPGAMRGYLQESALPTEQFPIESHQRYEVAHRMIARAENRYYRRSLVHNPYALPAKSLGIPYSITSVPCVQ